MRSFNKRNRKYYWHKYFDFHSSKNHSKICLDLQKSPNTDENNINKDDKSKKDNFNNTSLNKNNAKIINNKNEYKNKEFIIFMKSDTPKNIIEKANAMKSSVDIDNLILFLCKSNKKFLESKSQFVYMFNKLYNNIKIKEYHLHFLFEKYKKIYFPSFLDDIFNFCNNIEVIGFFCRSITKKSLKDSENKLFVHSYIIFFTDDILKRIIISEYLLLDGTFSYSENYYQTIILMYYHPIYYKIIP